MSKIKQCDGCAHELANKQLLKDMLFLFKQNKQLKKMKCIIEIGNDGGDPSLVGSSFDFCCACNEVARIIGEECYVKTKPIPRGKNGALWVFVHDGRTKWIRVSPSPCAESFRPLENCKPVINHTSFV